MARRRRCGRAGSRPARRARRGRDRGALRDRGGGRRRRRSRRAPRAARRAAHHRGPEGIEEAEDAARGAPARVGAPPQLATPRAARRDRRRHPPPGARARPGGAVTVHRGARGARADRRAACEVGVDVPRTASAGYVARLWRWRAVASFRSAVIPRRSCGAARVRGAAGRGRQGGAARAVRDADAEHRRRAHGGRAGAGRSRRAAPTSRRRRFAMRCACFSRRRSRSSPQPARASCASRRRQNAALR